MTVRSGTITGVMHIGREYNGFGVINKAIVSVKFPTYTATTDSFSIAGVGAAIETFTKRGKTNTIKYATVWSPGKDATGTACYPSYTTYAGALTVSTDALTGGLKASDLSTEVTLDSGGTVVPCQILVAYTEA